MPLSVSWLTKLRPTHRGLRCSILVRQDQHKSKGTPSYFTLSLFCKSIRKHRWDYDQVEWTDHNQVPYCIRCFHVCCIEIIDPHPVSGGLLKRLNWWNCGQVAVSRVNTAIHHSKADRDSFFMSRFMTPYVEMINIGVKSWGLTDKRKLYGVVFFIHYYRD